MTTPPLPVARLAGGITYQPQFTFQERRLAIADEVQGELLRSSPSSTWPPRGFEVGLADRDKIVIKHLRHEGWLALVSESDIYFQYDYPEERDLSETLRVQTELYSRITNRLSAEPIKSIGIKFITLHRAKDVAEIDAIIPKLVMLPSSGQLMLPAQPIEATVRISYPLLDGSAAALQLAADAEGGTLVVDLDCHCRDVFAIPSDHLDFYIKCLNHFVEITVSVREGILPDKEVRQVTSGEDP